jgi:hypothetical protein
VLGFTPTLGQVRVATVVVVGLVAAGVVVVAVVVKDCGPTLARFMLDHKI